MNGILEMKVGKNETDESIDSQIMQVVDASGGFYNLDSKWWQSDAQCTQNNK